MSADDRPRESVRDRELARHEHRDHATEYPLVRRFNVNGVPKTVIKDSAELLGAVTEEELVITGRHQISD